MLIITVKYLASVCAQTGSGGASYAAAVQKLIKMADANQLGQWKGKYSDVYEHWDATYSIPDASECVIEEAAGPGRGLD